MVEQTETTEAENNVTVVVESEEKTFSYDELGVTFDSSSEEILKAVQPAILEATGVNIEEDDEEIYAVKKIDTSKKIYVFPKSGAGKMELEKIEKECKYSLKELRKFQTLAGRFGIKDVGDFLRFIQYIESLREKD